MEVVAAAVGGGARGREASAEEDDKRWGGTGGGVRKMSSYAGGAVDGTAWLTDGIEGAEGAGGRGGWATGNRLSSCLVSIVAGSREGPATTAGTAGAEAYRICAGGR